MARGPLLVSEGHNAGLAALPSQGALLRWGMGASQQHCWLSRCLRTHAPRTQKAWKIRTLIYPWRQKSTELKQQFSPLTTKSVASSTPSQSTYRGRGCERPLFNKYFFQNHKKEDQAQNGGTWVAMDLRGPWKAAVWATDPHVSTTPRTPPHLPPGSDRGCWDGRVRR